MSAQSLCRSAIALRGVDSESRRDRVRPDGACVASRREECTSMRHAPSLQTPSHERLHGARQINSSFRAVRHARHTGLTVTASLMEPRPLASSSSPLGTGASTSTDLYGNLFGNGKEVETRAMKLQIEQMSQPLKSFEKLDEAMLEEAYQRCGEVTAEYAKTFYLGTKLMTPEKQRAIWAIYVWCRRTDELVDGPNASRMTPNALERWEERLDAIFEGRPYDTLDAALADTISKFPLDIQPFRDMIDGMRMDLEKQRYETFDELYEYCYRVAGTVALMSVPVMGVRKGCEAQAEAIYRAALNLGLANQLTNILRDVGEDAAERNRIYVPLEDLSAYGITEQEVLDGCRDPITGEIADKWKEMMKMQLERARYYFDESEAGIAGLDADARWPVWSALVVYRGILDAIVANGYDNFSMRAYVPKPQKIVWLAPAWLSANFPDIFGKPLSEAKAE